MVSPKTGYPTEFKDIFANWGCWGGCFTRWPCQDMSSTTLRYIICWTTKSSGPKMCSPAPPWGYFWTHLQWSWFRWKALAQCVAWKDSILMPEMMICRNHIAYISLVCYSVYKIIYVPYVTNRWTFRTKTDQRFGQRISVVGTDF